MKILYGLIIILLLASPVFAQDNGADDGRLEAFNKCVNSMKDIFTQSSTLAGKNGIKVTCIIMPGDELVSIGWRIENPDNATLAIQPADVRLYNGNREFNMVSAEQAIDILDKWTNEVDTFSDRQSEYNDIVDTAQPDTESREQFMYEAAFRFGAVSDTIVTGMTYFECQVSKLPNVTAEIKINGETFPFTFEGVGPS